MNLFLSFGPQGSLFKFRSLSTPPKKTVAASMLLSNANEKLINDILQVAALAVNFSFLLFTVDILEMNWKGSASACSTDSVSTDLQFLKMEFSQSQLRNCAQSTEGAGGWIRIL